MSLKKMLANHGEVMAKRSKWSKWRDDHLFNFFAHFNHGLPEGYTKCVPQEHKDCAADHNTLALCKEEILSFLHAIESGEIVLKPHREPQWIYAGTVGYEASNGWRIVIFNDANAWDYIELITSSDGRCVDFYDMEYHSDLNKYVLSDEVAWRRYGIPGYLQNRCKKCECSINADNCGIYLCQHCISDASLD
ncbi:MAG: hypothetical protein V4673_15360 [Pseudomonadota bacterium]